MIESVPPRKMRTVDIFGHCFVCLDDLIAYLTQQDDASTQQLAQNLHEAGQMWSIVVNYDTSSGNR